MLRTSRLEARRLIRETAVYGTQPSRLAKVVPSLVTPSGNIYPPAFNAFQANALESPRRALRLPAAREVQRMVTTLDGVDAETTIQTLDDQRADAYLTEAARDTRPIWPDIARVLDQAKEDL